MLANKVDLDKERKVTPQEIEVKIILNFYNSEIYNFEFKSFLTIDRNSKKRMA